MSNNAVLLIVGLGNPGPAYEKSWHNLGFLALDLLRESDDYRYDAWQNDRQANAEVAKSALPNVRVQLAKPQTMMNNSGEAVAALMRSGHLRPEDLWVVHDDLDLPLGEIRISRNASAGGHRGVQSIIDAVGTQQFTRLRIGIATPERGELSAEVYVLQAVPESASATLKATLERAVEALKLAQMAGVTEAMNQYN